MVKVWRERDGMIWGWNPWDWIDYGFRYHRKKIEFVTSIISSLIGTFIAMRLMR